MNINKMISQVDYAINEIVKEVLKPMNADILRAVVELGESDTDHFESFMFGFTYKESMDFDTFANLMHTLDVSLAASLDFPIDDRPMSVRYDEYLAQNDKVALNKSQTSRFNAIVDKWADEQGWSGAVYGMALRQVQFIILSMLQN